MRHYIISPDRCLVHTQSNLIEGWETCKDLKTLMAFTRNSPSKQQEVINWIGPKIPANIWENVFGTMAKFPNMEIHLNIYHKITTGEWAIKCPKQRGSGASVSSEDNLDGMPKGFHMIGTIHSHPNMSAFWSGTDMRDQEGKYGLHFVFGLTNGLPTTYKCSIFTPNGYYDKEWSDVCEEIDFTKEYEPVNEWVEQIKKQELKPKYSNWTPHYTSGNTTYSFGDFNNWDDLTSLDEYPVRSVRDTKPHTTTVATKINTPAIAAWKQRRNDVDSMRAVMCAEMSESMAEILRSCLDFFLNNNGADTVKEILQDYDLDVMDFADVENVDFAGEFDRLLDIYEDAGYPDSGNVNVTFEQHGYKVTEEKENEQNFLNDSDNLMGYDSMHGIRKEPPKC